MTLQDVEAILGKGEQDIVSGKSIDSSGLVDDTSSARADQQTWVWRDGQKSIVVTIVNGKVHSKSKRGM
ncbi:MAG: hypothetical protein KF866_08945 [Phycisphaeraceae bacterium]|nr:hypothetical protein [Phycisphaeraceae bacterium]MCW5754005.1 hypothetical protein [Phycisphaeraceae bacterium]